MLRRALPIVCVALAACTTEPERVPVSISGVVNEGGQPLEGAFVALFRPAVNGLPEEVGQALTTATGSFLLSTSVHESRCIFVFVTVEIRDAGGAVRLEDRYNAETCGQNIVRFDF